ncbi:hypothetical protein U1Q18_015550 [Sarracenia purpurea var. burkii]
MVSSTQPPSTTQPRCSSQAEEGSGYLMVLSFSTKFRPVSDMNADKSRACVRLISLCTPTCPARLTLHIPPLLSLRFSPAHSNDVHPPTALNPH